MRGSGAACHWEVRTVKTKLPSSTPPLPLSPPLPLPPTPTPTPQELSLGALFWPFSLPNDKLRTRTPHLLVCVSQKEKEKKTERQREVRKQVAIMPRPREQLRQHELRQKISNWTNVQLYYTTRWQQQLIRRMFGESMRLSKDSLPSFAR